MRRMHFYVFAGGAAALTVGLLILAGCGGGGGPIQPPQNSPPPSPSAAFLQLLPAAQKSATTVGSQKCGTCHTSKLSSWVHTAHAGANVGCENCHGPGSVHVAGPAATNILGFPTVVSPVVCAQCHGPLAADYAGSPHAQPVADPVNSGSSRCLRCHSAEFRAQYIDEPISHGKTPDQVEANIESLSSSVLASFAVPTTGETASCGNCHDPHSPTPEIPSNGQQVQLRRATFNLDPTPIAPGAPLESYTLVTNQTCGVCHNGWGANPTDATLQASTSHLPFHEGPQYSMLLGVSGYEAAGGPIQRTSSHAEAPDQCVHCHMPNGSHTFTTNLDSSCAPCHSAADAASRESSVQSEIQGDLVALRTRMQLWSQAFFGNPDWWDITSNLTNPPSAAQEASIPIQVKRARYNYYFIVNDRSYGIHNVFYARYLIQVANQQLDMIGAPPPPAQRLGRQQMRSILEEDFQHSRIGARGQR